MNAFTFFHLPTSHTSSDVKPNFLYICTPAPRVEWGPQKEVFMPKALNALLVILPTVLLDKGAKGGLNCLNKKDPEGTLEAVIVTYLFIKVTGQIEGLPGTFTKASH